MIGDNNKSASDVILQAQSMTFPEQFYKRRMMEGGLLGLWHLYRERFWCVLANHLISIMGVWQHLHLNQCFAKGSTRRRVVRFVSRHWQRIVHFQKPLESNLGLNRAVSTNLYKVWCRWICIKVLEPHGTALGSTPEVSGNERFYVTDVSYYVKRAEPRTV
jgi:hypothetical protein